MARIDLVEPYAVRQARRAIRDSLMSHGEECVLIHTWHANEGEDVQPRCPACWNDIYKQGDRFDCDRCYGTTFDLGVKDVYRGWAIFTDSNDDESFTKRGLWHPMASSMHTEHMPDLWKRDFVVRVNRWSPDHRVLEIDGIYVMKQVTNESLRTGNAHGQTSLDNVSQIADLDRISDDMPISKFPVIGQRFERWDGKVR
jgi:hypothetical protein